MGIVMASGDGETLGFVLVTTKAIPDGYPSMEHTLEQRKWDKTTKKVTVTPIVIKFAIIHGITVLKVPPGFKAWCSGIITEAFCRQYMTNCDSPSILQVDRAPGHIDPVFNKLVAESGRMIVWTPAGGSSYIQACDDVINALIKKCLILYSTEWLVSKVMELQRKGVAGAVANPTLEELCQILAKALKGLTPLAQRRAFEHCLLTLPTDGSLDEEKGGKNVMALLKKYGESVVPTSLNAAESFPVEAQAQVGGPVASAWEKIIASSSALRSKEFHYDLPPQPLPKSQPAKVRTNR